MKGKTAEREPIPKGSPWGCRKYRYHCHLTQDGALSDFERYADISCRFFISEKRFPKHKSIGGKEKWQYLQEQV